MSPVGLLWIPVCPDVDWVSSLHLVHLHQVMMLAHALVTDPDDQVRCAGRRIINPTAVVPAGLVDEAMVWDSAVVYFVFIMEGRLQFLGAFEAVHAGSRGLEPLSSGTKIQRHTI